MNGFEVLFRALFSDSFIYLGLSRPAGVGDPSARFLEGVSAGS